LILFKNNLKEEERKRREINKKVTKKPACLLSPHHIPIKNIANIGEIKIRIIL